MREGLGKSGEDTEGAEGGEAHRNSKRTAAEGAAPASKFCGLAARFGEEGEGNDGGGAGLLIEPKMAGFNGMNRRQSREGFLPWFGAGISDGGRRKRDVIADITVGPTCQSLREKKELGARLSLRGLAARG